MSFSTIRLKKKKRNRYRKIDGESIARRENIMIIFVIAYLGFSFIIALVGINRRYGFWGYFFCSLLVTPLIAAVILFGAAPIPKKPKKCPECDYPLTTKKK